jgi:hypothetical protein
MITGIDLNATTDYVLKSDKSNPTVWKLGIVPSLVFMKLASEAKDNEIEASYKILRIALKGWDNFNGIAYETFKESMFGRDLDIVPLSLIERIPTASVMELAVKAMEINSVTDDEAKN